MNAAVKTAVIYARVSTARQAEEEIPGDLTRRLRRHNAEINRLEQVIDDLDSQLPPAVDVMDEEIGDLRDFLVQTIKEAENPKKIRHFFGSFIDRIVVGDDQVSIDYAPQLLVTSQTDRRMVPIKAGWLPGRTLLGTVKVGVALPVRFHKRAA